jgi:predicted lipoprotein with Yx(FWY)xxD motif
MMTHRRRSTRRAALTTTIMGAAVVGAGLLASACSTSSSSGSGAAAASGSAGSTGSSATAMTVATRSTSHGVVLVTSSGMTLYHRTDEVSGGQIKCLADCTPTWPPYTVPAGTTPTGASGVTGLGTTMRPDGTTQVTFNGQPLYHYIGDSSPGQTNGNGIGGIWFVEKPAAASSSAGGGSSSSSSSSSSSGGSNYGGGY